MLELHEVSIQFGGLTAVNKLTLSVGKGEIVGLIGPNGAGKTTAFNAISGVHKLAHGEIYFDNERIDTLKRYEIAGKGITRTYQNINLFKELTVLDNVKIGCHCHTKAGVFAGILRTPREKKEEALITEKSMDLLKYIGLDHKSKYMAGELPYGDQRRLEICRAMASNPQLILLDEPAAGMNTTEKEALRKMVKDINQRGFTILLVEHDMKLVMGVVDRIYVLNYGAKIAEGVPDEIKRNPEVISAYLGGVE